MSSLSQLHQSAPDVPMVVASHHSRSERRVAPAWSLAQLKTRLEPITGVPATCQRLTLRIGSQAPMALEATDDEAAQLSAFPLQPYAEIYVHDTRPAAARTDFSDVSAVDKYVMPADEYEHRSDSVLAWKKAQKLGRFDPNAGSLEEQKVKALEREVHERGIQLHLRCQLLPASSDARRGAIAFIGPVPDIPGTAGAPWIGIALDEPTGKNDGSVKGTRYFDCKPNCGVFVRPERVEVGDFAPLDDGLDEDLEEI
ncbi:uncharacterized protein K452DRAFT_220012 [Aplosporella prunicola CBS 121167]|uniref:CAP-Gly domain-containing protein n=1 Tax=Aplosporella prunicola CBS 121167 TaxID=1176127 RepID=A0A6A6BRQ1_9PEZI|nr:uncharacterized protein K452DRAFT_220012 [Aplosporella prunicola CBS 121167]KAF2145894.1 hypothetical protein K452DRAFT_220012 [Aplosporella prunicola CBS 121167]